MVTASSSMGSLNNVMCWVSTAPVSVISVRLFTHRSCNEELKLRTGSWNLIGKRDLTFRLIYRLCEDVIRDLEIVSLLCICPFLIHNWKWAYQYQNELILMLLLCTFSQAKHRYIYTTQTEVPLMTPRSLQSLSLRSEICPYTLRERFLWFIVY